MIRSLQLPHKQFQTTIHHKNNSNAHTGLYVSSFLTNFCDNLAAIGNVATRADLDMGKCANNKAFRTKVSCVFTEELMNNDYDKLKFTYAPVFMNEIIDPAKIVKHNWKKVRSIWKMLNLEHKVALTCFTQSGTHKNNFCKYSNCKKHTYYLLM